MAWPANSDRLLFYITIKEIKANKEPATSGDTSKKHSKIPKTTSSEDKKKHEEMGKHHRTKYPKKRTLGPPRGARKRERRQQRKRVRFVVPKRSPSAFFLFMDDHRPQLQKLNPHWTMLETVKKLGRLWHEQSEEDKEMYKEEASRLRRKIQKRKA